MIGAVVGCVADNVEDAIIPDAGLDHGRAAAGDDRSVSTFCLAFVS